tara:strand:+ start:2204 stop:3337 length:1134 start_codon:yes stop_codon:yes gene_type:complete
MPVNIPAQTKYLENANDIKWSTLRSTFNSSSTGEVKFSTYRRDTDKNSVDPIIPDATENNGVSTGNDLKVSGFRGVIKEYGIQYSGTEANVNLGLTQYWNQNLNKNIKKKITTVDSSVAYASNTSNYAMKLDAEMYNVSFNHSGQMYGQGGNAQAPGGPALYLFNRSILTGASATTQLKVTSTGRIWAGGGGGNPGNRGSGGGSARCYSSNNYQVLANNVGPKPNMISSSNRCRRVQAGGSALALIPRETRSQCRGGGSRRSQGYPRYMCSMNWIIRCTHSSSYTISGSPGNGGNGGPGRGYDRFNSSLAGSPGNGGSGSSCPGGGAVARGNAGNAGASGAEWGQSSGGAAGKSITGNRFNVVGETTTRIKGPKSFI